MTIALDHDGRGNAHEAAELGAGLFLELVDDHRGGVRQLVARETEQLFAHGFGREELLAAVGQLVLAIEPGLLRQILGADAEHALDILFVLGRHGHELGKRMALLHVAQPGRDLGAAAHGIELVGDQQRGDAGLEQAQHLGVGQGEAARFDHEQDQVHVADRAHHGLVQRLVQGRGMLGLETGRVHEDELGFILGTDARDAVARGLGLARGDGDLLAHQCIHQRGLAHIGLAHDGDQAAALLFWRVDAGRLGLLFVTDGRRRAAGLGCRQHGTDVVQAGVADIGSHSLGGFLALGACCTCGACYFFLSSIGHGFLAFNISSTAVAAACSPMRREAPCPWALIFHSATVH